MSLKTHIVPALAASLLVSGAALAATLSKTGQLKSTDSTKHQLTLSSGDTFELPAGYKTDALKPGEKVKVSYEMKNGKMMASVVQLLK